MKIKKTAILIAALSLLLCALLLPASAHGEALVTLRAHDARPGDTVTVSVIVNAHDVKSMGFTPKYDTNVLELVEGDWTIEATLKDGWDKKNNFPVLAFDDSTDLDGEVFRFTFRVKENAKLDETTTVGLSDCVVKDGQEHDMTVTVEEAPITVSATASAPPPASSADANDSSDEGKSCKGSLALSPICLLGIFGGSTLLWKKKER